MRTIILTISVALATAALSGALAQAPQASEDDDKFVLENEHVRVWFQGKKPMLKVLPADAPDNGTANGSYGYQFRDLVEYRDLDGDGVPSNNEVLASLSLHRAKEWNVTREQGEDNVTLTLSLLAPVKLGRDVGLPTDNVTDNLTLPARDAQANVTLVFRIFETQTTIAAGNETVVVPETAIKYDLLVGSWPFVDPDVGRLALEVQVTGELELDGENATVVANDTTVGALSWVSTAQGSTSDGEDVEVPVRVGVTRAEQGMSRFVFTYDAPALASLVHDPTVGIASEGDGVEGASEGAAGGESSENGVPAPGLVAVAAVAASAALLRRRS